MPYFSEFFETFCSAAVEASYYGVKVVTNNVSGLLETQELCGMDMASNYISEETEELVKFPKQVEEGLRKAKRNKGFENPFKPSEIVQKWLSLLECQ